MISTSSRRRSYRRLLAASLRPDIIVAVGARAPAGGRAATSGRRAEAASSVRRSCVMMRKLFVLVNLIQKQKN